MLPGHKDAGMLQSEINTLLGADAVSLSTDAVSEAVVLSVTKLGFQLDLTASAGLSELLGFRAPFRVPEQGVLGEISARLANNMLAYSFSKGGIEVSNSLSNARFSYKGWNALTLQTQRYQAFLSPGLYTPSQLASTLNAFASSVGHPADLFDFGDPALTYLDHAVLSLRYPGFVFLFAESNQAQDGTLGFASEAPQPEMYWQVTGSQLPNEISAAALNNRFAYAFISGERRSKPLVFC